MGYFLRGLEHQLAADDLARVAALTDGWSAADLETMCREAALAPLRALFDHGARSATAARRARRRARAGGLFDDESDLPLHALIRPIDRADFEHAYETLMMG